MKKLLSAVMLHTLLLPSLNAQQARLFNQEVTLKSCNINIQVDDFIATTFIEMEFYNPRDVEVESYQSFRLKPGQVITAFQLDLNGKYRDGSIEERWKAARAYSTIVGKRVDPALLQMSHGNYYSLNIYPVPAHGSRKVTMTIDQLMTGDTGRFNYVLPMNFSSVTESFKLNINAGEYMPVCNKGILNGLVFDHTGGNKKLDLERKNIQLNEDVSFSIPLRGSLSKTCASIESGKAQFLLHYYPSIPKHYPLTPNAITVFWDASASSASRDIKKELDFLEQYIAVNKIKTATVTLFNHKILNTVYYNSKENFTSLKEYLLNYRYYGATCFGNLDLSGVKSDAILIFSDGYHTYGNSSPATAMVQVSCISSAVRTNRNQLDKLVGTTGGALINLSNTAIPDAVKKIERGINFIMGYSSLGKTVHINESFPLTLEEDIFLSGTFSSNDRLQLMIGNNRSVNKVENINLSFMNTCQASLHKKIKMLKAYDAVLNGDWQDMVIFGLQEKVVTPQTSFLVLERIEDYIKYNIAPPAELEEACAERNYVYKSEFKIKALKSFSEQDALQASVVKYNAYVKWWNAGEEMIDLQKKTAPAVNEVAVAQGGTENTKGIFQEANNTIGETKSNSLKEVIVTSAFNTKRTLRSQSSAIQVVNADQLNIVRSVDVNNAIAGKVAGLQVTSQSGVALGRESRIRLRGENGLGAGTGPIYVVDGTIIPDAADINVDDIEDITVLQGPASAALFGPDGSNGAIVINQKKGKKNYYYQRWAEYKLKNIEEVDYMADIKGFDKDELWDGYVHLERMYKGKTGFYFDMADYFFEKKLQEKGKEILFEGIESCNGDIRGLKAAAYILEEWKFFDEAIKIYLDILTMFPGSLSSKRDLALAYFQKGSYQQAVDIYYQIISSPGNENYYSGGIRVIAMNEMNAVIALHKDCLDLGSMNLNLVKTLPIDLRMTVESNYGYVDNLSIKDAAGNECSYSNVHPKAGGNLTSVYWDKNFNVNEYSVKNAIHGLYRIKINVYNYNYYNYYYKAFVPHVLRIVVFKNFQKEGQTMKVEHIVMDNQYGSVEVAEVKW